MLNFSDFSQNLSGYQKMEKYIFYIVPISGGKQFLEATFRKRKSR